VIPHGHSFDATTVGVCDNGLEAWFQLPFAVREVAGLEGTRDGSVVTSASRVAGSRSRRKDSGYFGDVGTKVLGVACNLVLVAVIVGVDVLFLRHHSVTRLVVDVAVVVVFTSIDGRFVRRSWTPPGTGGLT
jgi:hypothetical protein